MKIGSTNVNNLKLGDTQISKVYIGEDLIWQNVNPDFIFTIDTRNISTGSTLSNQFKLPLHSSSTVNATVYWGDGTSDVINVYNQAETTHTYSTEGEYIITISGVINGWQFNNTGDRLKILDIMNWGTFTININSGFYACTNLTCSATDAPTIITSTLLNYFRLCRNFNGAIGNWDVSGVTSIGSMFNNATVFNQPLNNWDVSNVISFSSVFSFAVNFNQDISNWNTGNGTSMSAMFYGAYNFNQPLDSWDVSSVTTMLQMFRDAYIFNQSLNSWDVSSVTNMSYMFWNAYDFDQPLFNWDVSSVITMNYLFALGSFNQDISTWNVSNVTTMQYMFGGSLFNQYIGNWDVSSVTNMQDMFRGVTSFNQDISDWDISNVTNFDNFMLFKTSANYDALHLDAIYNKWSLLSVQPNLTPNFGSIKYTSAGVAGKAVLTSAPNNWTITDGGLV